MEQSGGYINEKPLRALSKYLDAACVDLKAFTESFYAKLCGGRLKPVLDSLIVLKDEGVWIEITNLVIPTHNDDLREVKEMCRWIVKNLGPDVPIHFSRFFPHYKLKNLPPTPLETLRSVRQTAIDAGIMYPYIGNTRNEAENTYCPNCKRLLIERMGYIIRQNNIVGGRCRFCNTRIAGLWEA